MSPKVLILNKIADYLARRDHSVKEILDKLEKKKIFDKEDILDALKTAQESKWFLPEDELAQKVHDYLIRKRKSYNYIQQYLKNKDLPGTEFNYEEEVQTIKYHIEKRFQRLTDIEYDDKQKVLRSLVQKGFNTQICFDVLKSEIDTE